MKRNAIQRLLSLNLALIMLLSMLPVPISAATEAPQSADPAPVDTQQEEAVNTSSEILSVSSADQPTAVAYYDYSYIYHYNRFFYPGDPRPSATYSTLNLDRYANNSGFYGYEVCGWALSSDGMPVKDASIVPEPTDADVNLYACWSQEIGVSYEGFHTDYWVGPIQIGDTVISSADVMTTTPIEGTGWSYALGELTLTEDYPGDPIIASEDLIVHVEGDVTVRGTDGPAITAGEYIHFCANKDGSLHLYGGTGSPAVSATAGIRVESPLNLEMLGDNVPALDNSWVGISDLRYKDLAKNIFLCNRLYTGNSAGDAVLQPAFPTYVHDPNPGQEEDDDIISSFSDLVMYAYTVPDPTTPYLRFEAVDPADVFFTIYMDPQGGSVSGLAPGEPYQLLIPYTDATVSTYYSTTTSKLTLPTLPEPVRDGYLFLGWNSGPASDLATYYTKGSTLTITNQSADSLYAIWQEIPDSDYVVLDGNGKTMSSYDFSKSGSFPRYILPLTGGQAELPDLNASEFAGWSTTALEPFPFWIDGLLQPDTTVALTSGSTLYAVYSKAGTPYKIYGNGYTTVNGNDFIQVGQKAHIVHDPATSSSDLVIYSDATSKDVQLAGAFSAPKKALLDFGYSASSSSFYFELDYHYYAQWADAPSGSVVLYSDGVAKCDNRYGKVVSATGFSLTDGYGFARSGYDFAGWSEDGSTVLTQLPSPDQNGHITLSAVFNPRKVTYHVNDETTSETVDSSGKVTINQISSVPSGCVFNGWNTAADGSGQWYLPDQSITPDQSIDLYAQYLNTPADGNWVLFKDPDGPALYIQQTFDSADENGMVNALFPISASSWINTADNKLYTLYGYYGGEQYLVPNRSTFTTAISGYQFHGNGGLFPGSYPLKVERVYASGSSLITFPTQSDFAQTPSGLALSGWSGDQVTTHSSTIYAPGKQLSFSYGSGNSSVPKVLYAVWENPDIVYVQLNFSDVDSASDRDESFTERHQAGQAITLPAPAGRLGYQFSGWSDGTNIFPSGSSYTVPDVDTTLTAQWTQLTGLIVGGTTYDATIAHDYSNGGTSGWKYTPGNYWNVLYLYNYNGGAIYAPLDTQIYLTGSNVITAEPQQSAISSAEHISIMDDYQTDGYGSLTATGGSGAPAVSAYQIDVNRHVRLALTGGSGAPAASVSYQVYLSSGHAVLQGAEGMPAIQTTSTYYSGLYFYDDDAHCYVGEDRNSAVEINDEDDYSGQSYVYTTPVYITLTLDGAGGKVNGRSTQTCSVERYVTISLKDFTTWHPRGSFLNWTNQTGSTYSGSSNASFYEDTVLTANWETSPYENYVYFKCWNDFTVNGEKEGYLELPASGMVQLPVPERAPNSTQIRNFYGWNLQDREGNHVMTLPAVSVPVDLFEPGYTITVSSTNNTQNYVYLIDPNGQLEKDEWAIRRSSSESSMVLERWYGRENPYGYVVESWNTEPDGSGNRYEVGSTYTFDSDSSAPDYLYVQWKEPFTHKTIKASEKLPGHTSASRAYGRTESGEWMADFLFWRTADGSKFYEPGSVCDLPAGTTVYGYFGNLNTEATIRMDGNGAKEPLPIQFAQTWQNSDYGNVIRTALQSVTFTRKGYALTGWNTKADGSGTQYAVDYSFPVGTVNSSNNNWNIDSSLCAKLPKVLYAQWEQLPGAEIPVPLDMSELEDSQIYLALYDKDNRMRSIYPVEPGTRAIPLYHVPAAAETYQFMCLSGDGTLNPIADAEPGNLP